MEMCIYKENDKLISTYKNILRILWRRLNLSSLNKEKKKGNEKLQDKTLILSLILLTVKRYIVYKTKKKLYYLYLPT